MIRGKIPPFFIGIPLYIKAFSFMAVWPWPVVLFFILFAYRFRKRVYLHCGVSRVEEVLRGEALPVFPASRGLHLL